MKDVTECGFWCVSTKWILIFDQRLECWIDSMSILKLYKYNFCRPDEQNQVHY